jgi:integrase
LPAGPDTVISYLNDRAINTWSGPSGRLRQIKQKAPLKLPSLLRRLWAIKYQHKQAGYFLDTSCTQIEDTLISLKRSNRARKQQKDPLLLEDIRQMAEWLQGILKKDHKTKAQELLAIRDRALLLVGFTSAMRRSELTALTMEDLKFVEEGIEVSLTHSKTGARDLVIPYGSNPLTCPVRALKAWLKVSGIEQEAIFRPIDKHGHIRNRPLTGAAVALIIKRNGYIKQKMTEAQDKQASLPNYSGHSLRAGFCTTAAIREVPLDLIAAQAGHRDIRTTTGYIRRANKWKDNAAIKIGL